MTDNTEPNRLLEKTGKAALYLQRSFRHIGKAASWCWKTAGYIGKKSRPVLRVILPPFILAAIIFVLLFYSGLGETIGENLSVLTGPVPALLIIAAVCFIPVISPMLGPGLLIAIAVGIFTGAQIAAGAAFILVIPALLAIDAQLGNGFIPPCLGLGENEPETINAGVPGRVFTRLITIPASVVIAFLFVFVF